MPSDLYRMALEEARKHHARSKTYSGKLLRPHKVYLTALIEECGIAGALDYGCGKGEQYRWVDPTDGKTLEELWGFEVAKFDPAWPAYEIEPDGSFDLVICTHTLGSIPIEDHAWVLDHIFRRATKAVFIAEKIGGIKKVVHGFRSGFVNGWSRERWIETIIKARRLSRSSAAVHFSTVEKVRGQKQTIRSIIE